MSSSGSWSGAGGRPADIIDLDRFMRGGVRPPRHRPCDRLVVDDGSPSLKGNASSSRASTSVGRLAPPPARGKHRKRFSHDSGLSEGSYATRRHGHHRRAGAGGQRSSGSLRAFRAVCERALLEQQQQIARVAQLCERLTVQRAARAERGEPSPSATATTSDMSSSSRSTRDQKRKDKHRTQQCKTYKLIMNKLDELNRLFAARGRAPAALAAPPAPRRTCSSDFVSVSDKLVATEPEPSRAPLYAIASSPQAHCVAEKRTPQLVERAVGSGSGSVRDSPGRSSARSPRVAVTRAYAFDISPREALHARQLPEAERPNVLAETILRDDCLEDPRCGFDLDDPVHLYSQAKRLQALHASTRRRALSDGGTPAPSLADYDDREREREREREHERIGRRTRDTSLCAMCRYYWRSFRHFLAGQLFCYPDNNCKYS